MTFTNLFNSTLNDRAIFQNDHPSIQMSGMKIFGWLTDGWLWLTEPWLQMILLWVPILAELVETNQTVIIAQKGYHIGGAFQCLLK